MSLQLFAAFASLAASTAAAEGQRMAGIASEEGSKLDAFNIETDRERSKIEAMQRHNDRLEQYRMNNDSNIAAFYAMGRDVGSDKSVQAFLEKQKQTAADDTRRSDLMGAFEAMKLQQQSIATRVEGRARKQAAMVGALSTQLRGAADFASTLSDMKGKE